MYGSCLNLIGGTKGRRHIQDSSADRELCDQTTVPSTHENKERKISLNAKGVYKQINFYEYLPTL